MKIVFLIAAVVIFCVRALAQDSTVAYTPYASIKQDVKLFELMEKYREYEMTREFTEGYRIQITYTNIREDIYKAKGEMYKEFPALASYVEYEEPSYKLRLGDFKTRLEASYYLRQITPTHPGAFIVKDKIKQK